MKLHNDRNWNAQFNDQGKLRVGASSPSNVEASSAYKSLPDTLKGYRRVQMRQQAILLSWEHGEARLLEESSFVVARRNEDFMLAKGVTARECFGDDYQLNELGIGRCAELITEFRDKFGSVPLEIHFIEPFGLGGDESTETWMSLDINDNPRVSEGTVEITFLKRKAKNKFKFEPGKIFRNYESDFVANSGALIDKALGRSVDKAVRLITRRDKRTACRTSSHDEMGFLGFASI